MRMCVFPIIMIALAAPAHAGPIELAPGLWQIESEETQDVANDGRLDPNPPVTSSELRCLDEESAWLVPSDYADSFTSRGCQQENLLSTPLDFEGVWSCRVDGLDLTINMSGEANLTGDAYATLMTVTGRNTEKSVNMKNSVTAKRMGECPVTGEYIPPNEAGFQIY